MWYKLRVERGLETRTRNAFQKLYSISYRKAQYFKHILELHEISRQDTFSTPVECSEYYRTRNPHNKDQAMAESVNHRLLTPEARGLVPEHSACNFVIYKLRLDGFLSDFFCFLLSVSLCSCSIVIALSVTYATDRSNWQRL